MAKLLDYFLVLDALVQDKAFKLSNDDRMTAIQQAVAEHGRVRPIVKRRSIVGTGSFTVGTPTGWDDEFSTVRRIEFPVGQRPPSYLPTEEWLMTSSPTGATRHQIQFQSVSPSTAQSFNLEWSTPHVVSESTSTIPEGHYRAVATLGASYACLMLAGYYAQSGDPLIAVDSQDPQSKSAEYRALAKEYRVRWEQFFGVSSDANGAGQVAAAGLYHPVSSSYSWGAPFLTHRHRRR